MAGPQPRRGRTVSGPPALGQVCEHKSAVPPAQCSSRSRDPPTSCWREGQASSAFRVGSGFPVHIPAAATGVGGKQKTLQDTGLQSTGRVLSGGHRNDSTVMCRYRQTPQGRGRVCGLPAEAARERPRGSGLPPPRGPSLWLSTSTRPALCSVHRDRTWPFLCSQRPVLGLRWLYNRNSPLCCKLF